MTPDTNTNGTATALPNRVYNDENANDYLGKYRRIMSQIHAIDAEFEPQLQKIETQRNAKRGDLPERAAKLMDKVIAFYDDDDRKKRVLEAKGANQVVLSNGTIKYRKSPDSVEFLEGFNEQTSIDRIQAHKTLARMDWVKTERKLVKTKLKGHDESLLAEVGIRIKAGDVKTSVDVPPDAE